MSSLFSYELDESQIRLTLHNSRAVEYSDSSWDDFETNYNQACFNQTHTKFKLPEFNLNINRNIVLPVIFIAALVGVSAIMLSFVDFKTNASEQVEKGLVPNPDNYKPEIEKTAVVAKKEEPHQQIEKPVVKKDSVPVKAEAPVLTPSQAIVNAQPVSQPVNPPVQNLAVRTNVSDTSSDSKNTVSVSKNETSNTIISPNNQNYTGQKRKRRRKMPTEQIETIKAPSILNPQESVAKEPELELKLN